MTGVSAVERNRLSEAFAGNLLLATFDAEARALLQPSAELVDLEIGQRIQSRGQQVECSYFPFGPTMVSLVVQLSDERAVEVASIGREGAVGGIVSCGHAPAFAQSVVQVAGPALRVRLAALEEAKGRSDFIDNLFCRYSDYLLAQVMESVACNAFHSIQQRTARWLLVAQDRAGDRIALTQEALAGLLGVQRTTVNAAVGSLQEEGLLSVRRGRVIVSDREGLRRRACECYAAVADHFDAIIGPRGTGG